MKTEPQKPDTTRTHYTVYEAADRLGVSHRFIRSRIADGTLPAFRIKGSQLLRIAAADLDALMQPMGEH